MKVQEDEVLIWGLKGGSSEFKVYDFLQVLEATCNFSEGEVQHLQRDKGYVVGERV